MDAVVESVERDSDGPWVLPEGWATAILEELVERLTDGTHQPPKFTTSGVPFVVIGNIAGDRIDWSSIKKWVSFSTFLDESKRLRPQVGDVLYTAVGSYGHAVRVLDDREFMFQRHIAFLRPDKALIDAAYLSYALNAPALKRQADRVARGVAQKTVTLGSLREFVVPLAPLAEQKRIVGRVDALFAEIAEGEAALDRARKGLDTFRRALLKAAVTGELTKDWRQNNPVTETGHDLLARIKAQRAAKGHAKGRGKRAADAPPLGTTALPELPEGWAWGTLGEIADSVRNGTSAAPRAQANPNEILRISAVRALWVDESQIRYLDAEQATAAADATVESGDILFTRYNGSADLVGVGAIYRGTKRFYPDKIIRVRLNNVLSSHLGFVELAVNCGAGRKHIASNIKTTAGQQGLSGESLKETPIPIPPPAEAAEILRRVSESLAAEADTLAMLDAEAADAARLKQSILKSAFEGRLVPQDPTDEPASVILARLRASSSTATPARRGRRAKSSVRPK
jgi:type I restriction enzyme, S subunit